MTFIERKKSCKLTFFLRSRRDHSPSTSFGADQIFVGSRQKIPLLDGEFNILLSNFLQRVNSRYRVGKMVKRCRSEFVSRLTLKTLSLVGYTSKIKKTFSVLCHFFVVEPQTALSFDQPPVDANSVSRVTNGSILINCDDISNATIVDNLLVRDTWLQYYCCFPSLSKGQSI